MDFSTEPGLAEFLGRWGLGGLAAGFASGGWVGRRLSEVTAEDLADLGVPRAVRGEVLAALRAAVAGELAATLGGWMTPLAHAASGYLREEHPRLRLWSACDVAEMALRLIVIIGLAQVRAAHGGRLPRERLVRVFEHIRTPTLSHWRAMALETCKALEEDGTAECRELGGLLAPVARLLSDLVGHGGDTETASLLRLRNMLAHGSVSTSLARDLTERWRSRIDDMLGGLEPLASLPLLARTADGKVLRVSGEAGTVEIVPEIDPGAVGTRAGAAAIGLADRVLPLAPFVLRGVPRVGEVQGSREVPQIFLRRSEIVLEYMALGAEDAAFGQGDDEHLEDFERLFETPRAASERRFQVPGFERELRRDAEQFLGRPGELEALWTCATGPEQAGLYWLYGPPGIGKSILMARLMADLIDEAEERRARGSGEPWLVLAYRFRTGHESCRTSTFLGFLRERLGEVVSDPETGTAIRGLDDLQAVLKLLPLAARQARVLVPLDGLDEIAAVEPNFLSLDLASLVGAGGLWLCAGRPEGRLPEFMRRHGAREVLPGGLGGMETAAIRAMILEKAGPLGRKLLAGDRDGGDGQSVVNAFVEAVARKADGLPLYVRYVIGDILGNRLRFLDGREADGLPPSLTAYYEELVQRCAVGDDHVLATYALCLLALAYETLSEAAIADLLGRRLTLDGDADAQRARVRAALGRLGGMLTRGFTPEGEVGFRIYHESLREHLQQAPDLAITRRDTIDNILCKGATEPGKGPAALYLYRAGVRHLVEDGDTGSAAAALLSNFDYLMDRLQALVHEDPRSVDDISADWRLLRWGQLQTHPSNLSRHKGPSLRKADTAPTDAANVHPVSRFWRKRAHLLRRSDASWPAFKIFFQLAAENASSGYLATAVELWLSSRKCSWPWIRTLLSGYLEATDRCDIVLSDPAHGSQNAIQLRNGTVLSWSHDKTILHWDIACGEELEPLEGHHGSVDGICELRDGRVLSWAWDNTLRVWDSKNLAKSWVLEGHENGVSDAFELHDGRILSQSWHDHTLRIWNSDGGPAETVLRGHSDRVDGAIELHDGSILSWSTDKTLRLWDPSTGAPTGLFCGHAGGATECLELNNGDILSQSWYDYSVRIWDRTTQRQRLVLEDQDGAIALHDGNILSWSSRQQLMKIWDPQTGAVIKALPGYAVRHVGALELSNGFLLTWCNTGEIRVWDQSSEACFPLIEWRQPTITAAKELSDGRVLSWAEDGSIGIWDVDHPSKGKILNGHDWNVGPALELRDGRILSCSWDGVLRIWDPNIPPADIELPGHNGWVEGAFETRTGRILSWSADGSLRLWHRGYIEPPLLMIGHTGEISGALELRNGCILSWSHDGTLRIWDVGNGTQKNVLHAELRGGQLIDGAIELSSGEVLFWAGNDGTLRFWDLASDSEEKVILLEGEMAMITGAIEISNDEILFWSYDGDFWLWNMETGVAEPVGPGHDDKINGILRVDETRFLSWSDDRRLHLWCLRDEHYSVAFVGHSGAVNGAIQLKDGRIVSWSDDRTLRVWDRNSGAEQAALFGHEKSVRGAIELLDGRLVSWAWDDAICWWQISPLDAAAGYPALSLEESRLGAADSAVAISASVSLSRGLGPSRIAPIRFYVAPRGRPQFLVTSGGDWLALVPKCPPLLLREVLPDHALTAEPRTP